MIRHNYLAPSDDFAQYSADQTGKQEVSQEWFWEFGVLNKLDLWIYESFRRKTIVELKEGDRCFILKTELWKLKL